MQLGKKIRFWFLGLLWTMITAGIAIRLVYLAAYQRNFLLGQSKARVERQMTLAAKRGRILDRNGRILAMSKPVNDLWTSPKLLLAEPGASHILAKALAMPHAKLLAKLEANKHRDFLYLARNIDDTVTSKVKALGLKSVNATQSYARFYPGGKASAQAVGLVNIDGAGIEGIEYSYDKLLSGQAGYAKYLINPFGETIESIHHHPPTPGEDVQLTIDRSIQYMTYQALREGVKQAKAKSAIGLVLEVATGDIVAATAYPSFNPDEQKGQKQSRAMRNKVFTDLYEPGSTFKPIAMAYVLENAQIDRQKKIQTHPGEFKLGSHTVKDVRNFGALTLEDVLIRSSNIGIAKLMLASAKTFPAWLKERYHVGEKALRLFPGEPTSTIINKAQLSDFEHATLSFGYGLSLSPLHLGQFYLSIANGGFYQPVHLVRQDLTSQPAKPQRVLKPDTVKTIADILHKTTSARGTARRAAVSGLNVAGKTGTIHLYENGRYHDDRYIASFAGFAPYEQPKYVVVVVVEEPSKAYHYGGQSAAPIFSKIIANTRFISADHKELP